MNKEVLFIFLLLVSSVYSSEIVGYDNISMEELPYTISLSLDNK